MDQFLENLFGGKQRSSRRGNIFLLLAGAIFLSYWVTSEALSENASKAISLKQSLRLVLNSHPLITSKKLEYQAARSDLQGARWSMLPNASFNYQGFRDDDNQQPLDKETLTVSQPVWTGGRLSGNISFAQAQRNIAELSIIEAEQRLLNETVTAFIELSLAKKKVAISESNVLEHQRLSDIIKRRFEASTSAEVDLKLAQARLAFSRSQLLNNKNAAEVSASKLEQLIGQTVDKIVPPMVPHTERGQGSEVEKAALAFSPLIRKGKMEVSAAEASEKVARSSLYPQVSIQYEKKYGELLNSQDDEKVFLGLDFQPGAGLSALTSISANRARKRALNDSLKVLEREVRREAQTLWRQFNAAEMQLLPTKLLVSSVTEVVNSYLRQYTIGRKSWLDVLNAQRELVQAKESLADHEARVVLTFYKLQILVGKLDRETVLDQSG